MTIKSMINILWRPIRSVSQPPNAAPKKSPTSAAIPKSPDMELLISMSVPSRESATPIIPKTYPSRKGPPLEKAMMRQSTPDISRSSRSVVSFSTASFSSNTSVAA